MVRQNELFCFACYVRRISDQEAKCSVVCHRFFLFLIKFCCCSPLFSAAVYLWAEVLDADVYAAFQETGNVFDPDMAERVRKYVYSAGNTEAPDELFRKFRGRDPEIQYMLEKKSLVSQS